MFVKSHPRLFLRQFFLNNYDYYLSLSIQTFFSTFFSIKESITINTFCHYKDIQFDNILFELNQLYAVVKHLIEQKDTPKCLQN